MTNQIPQNDAVDGAFDLAGAVVEGQPVGDRGVIAAQAGHQAVQSGQVIGCDGVEPGGQPLDTGALDHHGGERGPVPGGGL